MNPFRNIAPRALTDNPLRALEHEIAQEKAAALGRLGRRLEKTLAALAAFDAAGAASVMGAADRAERNALVDEAGVALWLLVVQREACGLRGSAGVVRDYGVPRDVVARMGALPTPK